MAGRRSRRRSRRSRSGLRRRALRAFGFDFLAAGLRAALFFAAARFFLRAGAAFLAFRFFVFDFRFFAMIDLPIVAASNPSAVAVCPCRVHPAATAFPRGGNRFPAKTSGTGPPVAQSISSTV